MAAFLSGEMKDTVQMHPAGAYGLLFFFSAMVFLIRLYASSSGAFLLS